MLYIGNIGSHIQDMHLRAFLNGEVEKQSGRPVGDPTNQFCCQPGQQPVATVNLNAQKMFAFVEFTNAVDSDIAAAMDGAVLLGQPLRIRRPKNYAPVPGHTPRTWRRPGGVIPTHVPDGPNKVFLGGLAPTLGDDHVREFAAAFGELAAFHVARDSSTGLSKGYAFFAYVDGAMTDAAVAGLNGIELYGKAVTCKRANSGGRQQQASLAGPAGYGGAPPGGGFAGTSSNNMPLGQRQPGPMGGGGPAGGPGYSLGLPDGGAMSQLGIGQHHPQQHQSHPPPAAAAPLTATPTPPSRIVVMSNMVTLDDLTDDVEYDEIMRDVQEECALYGRVITVYMPRPTVMERQHIAHVKQTQGAAAVTDRPISALCADPDVSRIFVEYDSVAAAVAARQAISGRKFSDRTIIASFMNEQAWTQKPRQR